MTEKIQTLEYISDCKTTESCRWKIKERILIQVWRIDIVKEYINNFTWLTDEEKEEIMWK